MSPWLRLECQQQILIYFGYFSYSFGLFHFGALYALVVPLKNTRFQTIMVKIYTRFQIKMAQKPYAGAAHTYIDDID